ncbi:MAG: hypothetical protein V4753_06580 [Pseudomonadota bacterium]
MKRAGQIPPDSFITDGLGFEGQVWPEGAVLEGQGAVLEGQGTVLGMLLPAAPQGGKLMPAGVAFALPAAEIIRLLAPTGVATQPAVPSDPLTPAALA